jgi:hypothetical protein
MSGENEGSGKRKRWAEEEEMMGLDLGERIV